MGNVIHIFLIVLNMSMTATIVMMFVVMLRKIFTRIPRTILYAMWAIVFFRLTFPVSFASRLSVFNVLKAGNKPLNDIIHFLSQSHIRRLYVEKNNPLRTDSILSQLPPDLYEMITNGFWVYYAAAIIWVMGVIVILLFNMITYLQTKRKLSEATKISDGVYETDTVATPFVFGLIKPKVILPVGLTKEDISYIIQHEKIHIRRLDHVFKVLIWAILAIHWFNPFVWLAYYLMSSDMEMSCDEIALKDQNKITRVSYSESLFRVSLHRTRMIEGKLAFVDNRVKSRIKHILNQKPLTLSAIVLIAGIISLFAFSLITNPRPPVPNETYEKYINYERDFGSPLYATIAHEMSDHEREVVQPILETAENVLSYTGSIEDADLNVGALKRYYFPYNESDGIVSIKVDLDLITAQISRNSGTMWIMYSVFRYDDTETDVSGSADVLSCWQIEKVDENWMVDKIIERP